MYRPSGIRDSNSELKNDDGEAEGEAFYKIDELLYAFPTIFAFCLDLPWMSIALKRRSV